MEPSAQNLVLHSRDLTNAVWSGSNVTTAKNAVGADGVASGATTLTATAASGTVLQALSHASQSRIFSAYVRRVSGSGAIQMTTNGGTNWTTVTISSLYTQVACAAQTVASGTVGFRMAVSGDVIEVDFTQGEVGPVFTSPIPTTTAPVTRNADVVSVSGAVSGSIGQTQGTLYAEVDAVNWTNLGRIFVVSDGTTLNAISILFNTSNRFRLIIDNGGSSAQADISSSSLSNGVHKIAVAYANNDIAFFVDGVLVGTDTSATIPACSQIFLGKIGTSSSTNFMNDRIRAAALYTTRLTNAQLASLTTL
ncbi:MAG: hypothetical protein EBS36_07165 [Actinobacteria bacterium]|nr:hypothetical protein [Actinomycetota bacterium]